MNSTSKSRLFALLCVPILLLCVFATYPVAEIGMNDEWSYVQSAEVLARTGHIVYNGWATAMLGWQLYIGALFARLFGPSFTSIRASTVLVGLATAYLIHRTLVRVGITPRNAVIGTLAVVLGPLFLPLTVSFMTDIGGLFFIALCLYACLRAVEATEDRVVLGWLAFAAISNALGGTVRQIAWLGALVMFPCAVWLLRKRRHVVLLGLILYPVSAAIIFGSLRWFQHQPYSVPEQLLPGPVALHNLHYLIGVGFRTLYTWILYLLPLLLVFASALLWRERRTRLMLIFGGLLCVAVVLFLHHRHLLALFLSPVGNYVQLRHGFIDILQLDDDPGGRLAHATQLVLVGVNLFAVLTFATFLATVRVRRTSSSSLPAATSWWSLTVLLVPFTLAYLALLLPRAAFGGLYDRYLLPLVFLSVLVLTRLYQDRVKDKLPAYSLVLVAIFALYAMAGTYDSFSQARAKLAAIAELRAAGVPDTAIDAGLEHNAWVQVERYGYVNDPRIKVPANLPRIEAPPFPDNCQPHADRQLTPAIVPGYTISSDPAACAGPSGYSPVAYHGWLGFHTAYLYIVDTVKPSGRQP